jgi:cytochrome c biogenesis protein
MSNTDTKTGTQSSAVRAQRAEAEAREARELGEAGSQLSTAPREEALIAGPTLGVIGWIRWFWRQLTSMRVALILLFLLSLAAIPGSLIPQASADQNRVDTFIQQHGTLGPLYDKLQLFHVYSSVWFSAIYILLFVSLIGCIVPRSWQFVGQLRGRPPGAPRRLTRLPAYTSWRTEAEPEAVRQAALELMKSRRFRSHTVGTAVAAEKGYLRETGNLIFHVALIVMLLAFASGSLFKSEGGKLVEEGDGFANTLTQYDDFTSGSLFNTENLGPFDFTLDNFKDTYERSGPEIGTPRIFEADIHWSAGPGDKEHKGVISENHPLAVDGSKVFLISHGYAPSVTVKDGKGHVVFHGSTPLLPFDKNLSSSGAIKVMDGYHDAQGKPDQLGFAALFVPTFGGKASGQMLSQFPAPDFPVLNIGAYHGDLGVNSGQPQNVYQLDTNTLTPFKDSKGQILKQTLLPGETMKLPNGAGSITFDKGPIKEWASFQVTHQPGDGWALVGALSAIAGLAGSLFIQRRRVWVRAQPGPDGVTVVEMAGLGRSESARLPEELGDLAMALVPEAPPLPDQVQETAGETGSSKEPDSGQADSGEPGSGEPAHAPQQDGTAQGNVSADHAEPDRTAPDRTVSGDPETDGTAADRHAPASHSEPDQHAEGPEK